MLANALISGNTWTVGVLGIGGDWHHLFDKSTSPGSSESPLMTSNAVSIEFLAANPEAIVHKFRTGTLCHKSTVVAFQLKRAVLRAERRTWLKR